MADKRINALANTASSTASDDFIAVDGTTNGTRKLNAFSPTFGGNATVTGTLTVNGAGTSKVGGILRVGDASTGLYLAEDTGGNAYVTTGVGTAATGFLFGTSSNIPIRFQINSSVVARFAPTTGNLLIGTETDISGSGGLKVAGTTASTTTSTGALVVGNGTSGGLGVGGAANIGGALSMYGEDFTIHNVGYGSWVLRNTAGSAVLDLRNGNGSWLTFPNNPGTVEFKTLATTVKVAATTASTSTSSGALVVSGGVGVAGAINAGGTLRVVGSSQIIRVRHDAATIDFTNTAQDAYVAATVIGNTLQLQGNNGTGLTIGTTGNATFAGNITTAAPAGGTAAAWKLGTVATVSPTSPNRTIEVDIGGTIYYLAAKTTNN